MTRATKIKKQLDKAIANGRQRKGKFNQAWYKIARELKYAGVR